MLRMSTTLLEEVDDQKIVVFVTFNILGRAGSYCSVSHFTLALTCENLRVTNNCQGKSDLLIFAHYY